MGSPPLSHIIRPPLLPISPLIFLFFFFFLSSPVLSVNVTTLLAAYPELSSFTHLLTNTSVAGELAGRSSLTLLAVPNAALLRSPPSSAASADLADVLRYHVLLQYLSPADLRQIPPAGKLVTTLFQTTGRASNNLGAVNLTRSPGGAVTVRSPDPYSASNATILSPVTTLPYNVSVFAVDSLLFPYGFVLTASENRPPVSVNITRVLLDGRDFNVAAAMLEASGVAAEFEGDENGAGITVFVPTDGAFAGLPKSVRLQSLPADRKAVVLRFHVLHSYYPLGSLEGIVNPVQPTLATESTGAGRFTLNITRVNGSVAIDTGIVQASITRTVYDQNPVAVFAVSRVLLPREIFGNGYGSGGGEGSNAAASVANPPPPPAVGRPAYSPEESPEVESPPSRLSSPPGLKEESRSGGAGSPRGGRVFSSSLFCCIGILYLV